MDVLKASWDLLAGVVDLVVSSVTLASVWVWEVLCLLHTTAPRLEGLLIGVLLTWIFLRRDKHPILKALSAPLKIVVDILDLIWDEAVEITCDLFGVVKNWIVGSIGWVKSKILWAYNWVLNGLNRVKEWVSSKTKDSEDKE